MIYYVEQYDSAQEIVELMKLKAGNANEAEHQVWRQLAAEDDTEIVAVVVYNVH